MPRNAHKKTKPKKTEEDGGQGDRTSITITSTSTLASTSISKSKSNSESQSQRTFELDWGPVIDIVVVLSMLCFQLGESGDMFPTQKEEEGEGEGRIRNEDTEIESVVDVLEDDEDDDDFNDFDQYAEQQNSTMTTTLAAKEVAAHLKSRFLDRLAEILARVKKPPEGVKQVASAYMVDVVAKGEDDERGSSSQGVEIRRAKNEGLSTEEDAPYLDMLFGVLMDIARGGSLSSLEKARENLLKQTIQYARPRIDFHVEALRHEFRRSPQVQLSSNPSKIENLVSGGGGGAAATTSPSGALRRWSDWAWRDFDFGVASGEKANDRENGALNELDGLSCEAREEAYEGMQHATSLFQKVLGFCKTTNPPDGDLANVMKSAFILQTDVKSRAAFQGCFVGHFGLAFAAATRARRALLFLSRFYAAVLAFTEAAAQLPSFRNMSFVFVKPFGEVLPQKSGTKQKTAREAIAALSTRSTEALMAKLCRGKSETASQVEKDFDEARRQPCHVHAEIQLVDDFENHRDETDRRAHPYIGSSKLCCFLCNSFLRHHGFFQYRGTHWKLYHKWQVPGVFETEKVALVFEKSLRLVYRELAELVRKLVTGETQSAKDPLRPESIVDLSTAATMPTRDMAEMTLPSPSSRWMGKGAFGPLVMDDAVLLVPDFEKPGHTLVHHKGRFLEMSIADAENYKDRFEKLKLLPKRNRQVRRRCHRPACTVIPAFRCKACRASYCSRKCQNVDWHRHVFVCTVRGRPTLADSLLLLIRDAGDFHDSESQDLLRKRLLADNEVSTGFGFSECVTLEEVSSLISTYRHLTSRNGSAVLLQRWVDHGELEEKIKASMLARQEPCPSSREEFPAFTRSRQNRDTRKAANVEYGLHNAIRLLIPEQRDCGGAPDPSVPSYRVMWLYAYLLKDFDNLPDRSHSAWLDFGFCFCPSHEWTNRMADAYVELAMKASFSEITDLWDTNNRLDDLFEAKGMDITPFKAAGISFGRPTKMQRGVYQLMMEINHVHRGTWCLCNTVSERCCKRYPESRFSMESVVEYGFDKLSPWERWQMIVLWEDIFTAKGFDAREMLAARRSEDNNALQEYVERMVDARRYHNKYKTGALFPDLRGRLIWETAVLPLCFCICH